MKRRTKPTSKWFWNWISSNNIRLCSCHDPRLPSYFYNQQRATKSPPAEPASTLLFEWSGQSQADTIYIHDPSGTVVASSNYRKPELSLAKTSFRPRFASAIKVRHKTQYVALGARSDVRGYFLSSPLISTTYRSVITKVSQENLENILIWSTTWDCGALIPTKWFFPP